MGILDKLFKPARKVVPDSVRDRASFRSVVLASELPVLLDVWSGTCAPCRQLEVVLVDVATRYEGRIRVAEMSTAADRSLLAELEIRSTPTVLVFHGGVEVGRVSGFRPASWFDEMIETEFPAER